jgi:hypothetical protein
MKQSFGLILFVAGMMVAGGSANDCDGACMEQANDLLTTLMVASAGLFAMILGVLTILSADRG